MRLPRDEVAHAAETACEPDRPDERVKLYAVKAERPLPRELHAQFLALCSPFRRDKLRRYVREEDARRSLMAEMLLRAALRKDWLKRSDGVPLVFEENAYGKPNLTGVPRVHFNLSHSGDWCACAVSESPIGVDVEQVRQQELGWADKLLAEDEKIELHATAGIERLKRFFEIWTLKESYVKALGKGLSHGLNTFSVAKTSVSRLEPYRVTGYWLDDRHPAAVCALAAIPQQWTILSPNGVGNLLVNDIEAMRGECRE
ncbi:4'-phosphopantetheinyl transferase family protein [Cohnella cholangitidis]|uniref:4'-phosphopantetheinyl transferase superfamily protein n=1 Tax=Cohnella cholangitidis TaxID=2598458 RepID=A0A7G5BS85_9BACL|nr:4'-phosphopantetheinyl transferase superfamily protein [Cohnella cholangitidis]QMV39819.1 4'-phosphopantetheinyl transferase superfamily protein [Cohnella cholangitidis]